MKFNVGFATDVGRKRSQNQDSGAAVPELGLFIVSDGMGGHQGGETASKTAVETIVENVTAACQGDWDGRVVISKAIQMANAAIFQKAMKEPKLQGMGTTTTALLFKDKVLYIGHVGDSRCYFFRPQAIWQATRDHSLVQEKLRAGLITRKEVKTDKMKNVITRSVGFEPQVNVEIYQMKVQPGDCFLICSDGLSGLVEDLDLLKIMQNEFYENGDPQQTVQSMVEAANENGGDDNITTILVQVK